MDYLGEGGILSAHQFPKSGRSGLRYEDDQELEAALWSPGFWRVGSLTPFSFPLCISGLLVPPDLTWDYTDTEMGDEWAVTYSQMSDLLDDLGTGTHPWSQHLGQVISQGTGRSLFVQGQPGLYTEFRDSQRYMVRLCLKTDKQTGK